MSHIAGPGHKEAIDAVTQFVAGDPSVMELPALHRVLKSLAHSEVSDHAFARALAARLAGTMFHLAPANRSAFVVLSLLESGCADVAAAVRSELEPYRAELEGMCLPGATLLAKVSVINLHIYIRTSTSLDLLF